MQDTDCAELFRPPGRRLTPHLRLKVAFLITLATLCGPLYAIDQTAVATVDVRHLQSQAQRALSSEHVNLVRVAGESITDVVFDTEALEVSTDAAHGAVFVRVKPAWLKTGKTETAAYFNTALKSYGVMFKVLPVASQTIEIAGSPKSDLEGSILAPAAAAMARFPAEAYTSELKALTTRSLMDEGGSLERTVGATYAAHDAAFVALDFAAEERAWEGFRVKETRAYVTRARLVEVLEVRNLRSTPRRFPLARFARHVKGALALGTTSLNLAVGAKTRLVLISERAAHEGKAGITLTVDALR